MAELFVRNFRFAVRLRKSPVEAAGRAPTGAGSLAADAADGSALCNGAFQEVSGLEIGMDVGEHLEGGRNDGAIRCAGRARYAPIVLRRGMFYGGAGGRAGLDRSLWQWFQDTVAGVRPIARYDGVIEVLGSGSEVVATWEFDRGLPARIRGPALNARTGDVAIEELHIAHEGLRLA